MAGESQSDREWRKAFRNRGLPFPAVGQRWLVHGFEADIIARNGRRGAPAWRVRFVASKHEDNKSFPQLLQSECVTAAGGEK